MSRRLAGLSAAALALAGCGVFEDEEAILPGERVPVRAVSADSVLPPDRAAQIAGLGPEITLSAWPQTNGVATRAPGHLVGPAALRTAWTADVGQGSGGDSRITAPPVAADGAVFALDAAAMVTAVDAGSGAQRWRVSVAPEGQSGEDGFGGGLAFVDGRVIAATGFGEVVALSAADGSALWRQNLGAPVRAAPAVAGGRVFAVTRDSAGFALDAATGRILWRVLGARGGAGFLGGASPAVSGELVVLPFMSGELVGVRGSTGQRIWSDVLTGGRRGLASADIADVTGDPVIAGGGVFAANHSGQMVALDARTGRRGWVRPIGAASPAWPAGATLFVMSNQAQLIRLSAATGETLWASDLDEFEDAEDREDAIAYGGPVVAGGQVFVTSSRDGLLAFDAVTGERLSTVGIPGGASVGPIMVDRTLFVLSDNGVLHALR